MDLREEIMCLIKTKRESNYWDFKKIPHSNNSDLLHDIICMSNSLVKHSKYIIIGVSDPDQGCEIVGLGDISRWKQSNFIDFIKAQPFAAENRPEIEVKTIEIDGSIIDVIVILDLPNKPYYLSKDTYGLKANYIYTRIGDTNTPKDKSTDYFIIEKMWREKFGLDVTPSQKFSVILKNKDLWNIDVGNKKTAYYEESPEYQIIFDETHEGWEPYSCFFCNPQSFFGTAHFNYLTTTLFSIEYGFMDEFRIPIVIPETQSISISGDFGWYYYYIKNSVKYDFFSIIGLQSLLMSMKNEYLPFIFFENIEERDEFNTYLSTLNINMPMISASFERTFVMEEMKRNGHDSNGPLYIEFFVKEFNKWKKEFF